MKIDVNTQNLNTTHIAEKMKRRKDKHCKRFSKEIDLSKKPEKCTNCSRMQTGIKEGFCCYACALGKGHGPRC